MKVISVFDTTISDYNLGNEIIMEGVYKHLREVFPSDFFYKLPYMEITRHTIGYIAQSDLVFFGGTNSLSSRMEKYKQWGITMPKSFFIKDVILMGLGWWQYQKHESMYTKVLLKRVLSRTYIHSVRDSYTETKLKNLGFTNVLNTGCPSTWDLTPSHCDQIKKDKSDAVILTFTDYNKNVDLDSRLFELLQRNYKKIYVWIQGVGDKAYVDAICNGNAQILDPNLQSFDRALATVDADYVGTRLHAGIRAMQHKRRSIIVAVDNRALEINKDFNIPIVQRDDIDKLENMINAGFETRIRLPVENIRLWKQQFSSDAALR